MRLMLMDNMAGVNAFFGKQYLGRPRNLEAAGCRLVSVSSRGLSRQLRRAGMQASRIGAKACPIPPYQPAENPLRYSARLFRAGNAGRLPLFNKTRRLKELPPRPLYPRLCRRRILPLQRHLALKVGAPFLASHAPPESRFTRPMNRESRASFLAIHAPGKSRVTRLSQAVVTASHKQL